MIARFLAVCFAVFLFIPCLAQPDMSKIYKERLFELNNQLSLNQSDNKLLWERLKIEINLLGGFPNSGSYSSLEPQSLQNRSLAKRSYNSMLSDFDTIEKTLTLSDSFNIGPNQFYFYRHKFFAIFKEYDLAIHDVYKISKGIKTSYWGGTNAFYLQSVQQSLFFIHAFSNDYDSALAVIDAYLERDARKNPKTYFNEHGSGIGIEQKIALHKKYNKTQEAIKERLNYINLNLKWLVERRQFALQNPLDLPAYSNEVYTDQKFFLFTLDSAFRNIQSHINKLKNECQDYKNCKQKNVVNACAKSLARIQENVLLQKQWLQKNLDELIAVQTTIQAINL